MASFLKLVCLKHLNFGCLETAWYTLLLQMLSSGTQTVTQGLFVWYQENIPHLCEQVLLLELLWKKWKNNRVKCQSCWDSYLNSISPSHFSEEKVCLLNQKITFVDERMKGILPSSHTPSTCRFWSMASLKRSVWQHKLTTPILSHQM